VTDYVNFLLLGLGNGAVFAALAVALVVTYRSSGVLNFATGALSLHAAYTYAFLRRGELLAPLPLGPKTYDLGDPVGFWPALLATLVIEALLGVLLYVAVFRPLRSALPLAKAVGSLGVMILLTAIVAERAGSDQILVDPIFPRDDVTFGEIRIVADRLWFALTIVVVTLVLAAVFRFTRFGVATRASAETEVGALVTGLSPERIAMANWAISAAVAGLAGVLIAPLVPLIPGTYTLFIVPALAAAVLGRFSALLPAFVGAIAIGMLQSLAVFLKGRHDWFPDQGTAELIPLVLVLAALLVRSQPLPTRGTLVLQTLGRAPRPRSWKLPALVGLVAGLAAVLATSGSYRSAVITSLIFGVISLSLVVVTGYCGQISLAQLTLAGVAGFLLSPLTDSWGVPFPIAPLLAALGAGAIGVLVGLPALRIRGLLVGVVTLIFALTVEALWFRNNSFNGGVDGAQIANPELFGFDLGVGTGAAFPRPAFGILCLLVLAATAAGVAVLRTSRLGSAMLAVRANERSAAAAGISVVRVKIVGFAIGSFIAGIGGTLLAYKQTNVTFQSFSVFAGLTVFSTAFLAGITSVSGGIVAGLISAGGILFLSLDRAVDIGPWYAIASGLGVIITVIKNPEGVVGPLHHQLDERRQARLRQTAAAAEPTGAEPTDTEIAVAASSPAVSPATPDLGDAGTGAAPAPPVAATPAAGGHPALRVAALTVTYGGVTAVDDVSFAVPTGRITGLIGPNGAGKTTAMDAICGFTAYRGTVELGGRALRDLAPHRRARLGLGRTFQGLDLYEDLTVEENVVVGQYVAGSRAGDEHLAAVLATLDLAAERERSVRELSQGHRQLVSIARALAGQPNVLLLDEPAAGLDSAESEWLAARLRAVRDSGVTVLLVDHDVNLVLGLCDEIHVLDFGSRIASGPPSAIRDDPAVTAAYLGSTLTADAATGRAIDQGVPS
jgi:ABC-type branched-subunit amino acid transport system ATPase component/ABC-type branched-subunit amino acid transport system permease subunit